MPSRESSVRNLLKAVDSPNWHRPRPWRSREEAEIVRRYAFWWFNCRDQNKPSGRDWARQLGISHTWLQRLVREFEADPAEQAQLSLGPVTVLRKKSVRDEFVNKNLRETLDCSH